MRFRLSALRGILAPAFRALESPIAMACFLLVTFSQRAFFSVPVMELGHDRTSYSTYRLVTAARPKVLGHQNRANAFCVSPFDSAHALKQVNQPPVTVAKSASDSSPPLTAGSTT